MIRINEYNIQIYEYHESNLSRRERDPAVAG